MCQISFLTYTSVPLKFPIKLASAKFLLFSLIYYYFIIELLNYINKNITININYISI